MAAGEEVVVVQALEEMAGLPAVAFSRLPVLRHHVGVMGSDSGSVGSLCPLSRPPFEPSARKKQPSCPEDLILLPADIVVVSC